MFLFSSRSPTCVLVGGRSVVCSGRSLWLPCVLCCGCSTSLGSGVPRSALSCCSSKLRGCLNRKEAGKVSSRGSVQDYRLPTPTLCTIVNNKNTRGSQVVGLNSACWRLMVACLTSPEVVASQRCRAPPPKRHL